MQTNKQLRKRGLLVSAATALLSLDWLQWQVKSGRLKVAVLQVPTLITTANENPEEEPFSRLLKQERNSFLFFKPSSSLVNLASFYYCCYQILLTLGQSAAIAAGKRVTLSSSLPAKQGGTSLHWLLAVWLPRGRKHQSNSSRRCRWMGAKPRDAGENDDDNESAAAAEATLAT